MANVVYNVAKQQLMNGTLDLDTNDIRVLLLTANGDINIDDDTVDAVLARASTTEAAATGYARQAIGSEAVTVDDTNDRAVFDGADIVFSGVATGETIVGLIVYKHVTNDTDSIPIAHLDVTPNLPTNGSDITVKWDASGILTLA